MGCPPDRSIVVPTVAWNEAFRKVPQLLDQPRGSNKPKTVEVALEGTKVRLSSQERSFTCDQIDGRFPDWTQVLPKRGPAFTIYVNPDLLVDLLTAVKQMIGEYDKVTLAFWTDADPNDQKQLIEDPDEQAIMTTTIQALRQEGKGPRAIARSLNTAGLRCRGKEWSHSAIRSILRRTQLADQPKP